VKILAVGIANLAICGALAAGAVHTQSAKQHPAHLVRIDNIQCHQDEVLWNDNRPEDSPPCTLV